MRRPKGGLGRVGRPIPSGWCRCWKTGKGHDLRGPRRGLLELGEEPGNPGPRPALSIHPCKPRLSRAHARGPSPALASVAGLRAGTCVQVLLPASRGPQRPSARRCPPPGPAAFCPALRLLLWAPAISELEPGSATLYPLPTTAQPRVGEWPSLVSVYLCMSV